MNKKLILTSVIAICIVAPAMAEPSHTDEFPSDGLMQADYTYTNAATAANMDGVSDDGATVNADPEYEWNIITVNAGQYIPAGSTTAATCTTGNYCLGITADQTNMTPHYDASAAQGLTACPAGYTSSEAGASASTDCYRTCTTNDVANSANVTGMRYYNGTDGDGVNACEPTSTNGCVTGYHYVAAVTGPDLMTLIGASEAGTGFTENYGDGYEDSTDGMSNSVIAGDPMAFAVAFGNKGTIKGHGRCSTRSATNPWVGTNYAYVLQQDNTASDLTDETGQPGARYCYCQLDGYAPANSSFIDLPAAPGMFMSDVDDAGNCETYCPGMCASNLKDGYDGKFDFRAATFNSVLAGHGATCAANTITINWTGASPAAISANNAGTATYGGDIRTPQSAIPETGKRFLGWRFSAPTTSNP